MATIELSRWLTGFPTQHYLLLNSMFSLHRHHRSARQPRREFLRAGSIGMAGMSSPLLPLFGAEPGTAKPARAKSCVFLFLFGGPSQIDLWDMKPSAPAEIRGDFTPTATKVPGIHLCQHLPRLGQQMDKICLIRSMTHTMNVHGPACSEVFSGREYFQAPTTDQADEQDWPSLSAMAMRYGPGRPGLPPSVVLPWYLQFPGQAKRIAGQTGGRMGEQHNAMLVKGDSDTNAFQVDGLQLRENVSLRRIESRKQLLGNLLSDPNSSGDLTSVAEEFQRHRDRAYSLIKQQAGTTLDIQREPAGIRELYGNTMVGQSLLMARRLVEAGVSLITVNWEDETKISGTDTCWDTHKENFPKLKNLLCPIFDQAFPAFIQDLDERGLLESTLVVAVGEFGRTPHMGQFSQSSNTKKSGRDHWPSAFTALVAGGGVRGGQVYGATNHHASHVKDNPVGPADLTATILDHLGIDHQQYYRDKFQRPPHKLSIGTPLTAIS